MLAGGDVLAGAQTGTGKTAGFMLPHPAEARRPRRAQSARAGAHADARARRAGRAEHHRLRQVRATCARRSIFGGVSEKPQIDKARHGCDILVATPGRLLDLCEQRAVSLSEVQIFVLDEADRMLDMGFIRDIKRILKMLPQQRQNLMFSATYSDDIRQLANGFLRNPTALQVTPRNATADKVEQSAYRVPKDHKRHLLAHLINEGNWHQVLVFTRTKHGANRLTQQLERAGINAMAIHGNKSQNARVKALQDFKDNQHHGAGGDRSRGARPRHQGAAARRQLRAAERAGGLRAPHRPHGARGLDRRGVSLVSPDELSYLRDIEKLLKRKIDFVEPPKFEIKEGTHTPRRNAGAGEHQPHQDPRRRPEHRRQRSQQAAVVRSGGGGGGGRWPRAGPRRATTPMPRRVSAGRSRPDDRAASSRVRDRRAASTARIAVTVQRSGGQGHKGQRPRCQASRRWPRWREARRSAWS